MIRSNVLAGSPGSETLLTRALDEAISQGDAYQEAILLNNWGTGRNRSFRYDEAIPYFERAIQAARRANAPRIEAAALTGLGGSYNRMGDFERALVALQKAAIVQEAAGLEGDLQNSLGEMANSYMLQGEVEKAVTRYRLALDLAERLNSPVQALLAGNLASAYADLKNWNEAERMNEKSRALKRRLNDTTSEGYNQVNAALIAAGRGQTETARVLFEQAIAGAGSNRSLEWEAEAGLAQLYAEQIPPTQAATHFERAIAAIEQTRAGLKATDYKITFLSRLIRFYQDYVHFLIAQGSAARALQVAESSRARILAEKTGAALASSVNSSPEAYMNLARRSDSLLLSYWLAPDRSYVWAVTAQGVHCFPLPDQRAIQPIAERYTELLRSTRDPLVYGTQHGTRLYDMLISPVKHLIPSTGNIIIVPDGPLHGLNMEAILVPGETPHYWIEDVRISVAPSLDSLLQPEPARTPSRPSFLLIGDPEAADEEFPKLKFASEEVSRLQRRFPSFDKQVLSGTSARPAAYRDSQPERFSLVHFAAHGIANRTSPLESAIVLSPGGETTRLYARDILKLPLQANMVTISACRSAGARAFAGEGMVGLASAFLQAGSRRVVAGLWDVADESTAQLMDQLYAHLEKGEPPAEALRAAKLSLIHTSGNYRKPFYWAPFQLYVRTATSSRM